MVQPYLREQTRSQVEQYARQYRDSRRQLNTLTGIGTSAIARFLGELSSEIKDQLSSFAAPGDPFLTQLLPSIASDIQDSIDVLVRGASAEMGTALTDAWTLGGRITPSAFNAAGLSVAFPVVTPELLASASAATSGLFVDFGSRVSDAILREVRLSSIGLQPSSGAISRVVDLLRAGGVGERINFGVQGETIVRTELGRVYSNAQQAAAEQLTSSVPNLRKRWVTTLRKRRGHREAEATYAPGGAIGPIAIRRKFKVTDYSRTGLAEFLTLGGRVQGRGGVAGRKKVVKVAPYQRRGAIRIDSMLFPLDPGASVGNIANCSCLVIEVVPGLEEAQARAVELVQA